MHDQVRKTRRPYSFLFNGFAGKTFPFYSVILIHCLVLARPRNLDRLNMGTTMPFTLVRCYSVRLHLHSAFWYIYRSILWTCRQRSCSHNAGFTQHLHYLTSHSQTLGILNGSSQLSSKIFVIRAILPTS